MVAEDAAARHEEEGGPAPRGMWASTKAFLTKGSTRWGVLVGVGLLVGTVCLVSQHPSDVQQLGQQLLLHNPQAAGAATQAVRRSLSGTDPVHREWDDVKSLTPQTLAYSEPTYVVLPRTYSRASS